MKHYLNKFQNLTGYTNAAMNTGFGLPHVSLISSNHNVVYNSVFDPQYLYSDLSTSKNLDVTKTVIGIEVIPANHEADGKARFMSVKNMSCSNPEEGNVIISTDSMDTSIIPWGKSEDSVGGLTIYSYYGYTLDRNSSAITEENPHGFLNQLSSADKNNGKLISDYDNGSQFNEYPFYDGSYLLLSPNPSGGYYGLYSYPYPFNADGTKNLLYWNNGEGAALSDMDGAENTTTLINRINIEGWQTGALNIEVDNLDEDAYNYPAAAACYRFNPANSNTAHQWYLPSTGELGYVFANIVKINAKIDALPNGQGVKVGMDMDNNDGLGNNILSSTGKKNAFDTSVRVITVGISSGISEEDATVDINPTKRIRAFIAI